MKIRRYMYVAAGLCTILVIYWMRSYVNTPEVDIIYHQKGNPVNHIVFLKIHKAASTTVANLFHRYGKENHLKMAIPKTKGGGGSTLTSQDFYPPPNNGTYDISCAHVPYNRTEFSQVLPNDTVYIGIVRQPFSQFQSFVKVFRPRNLSNLKTRKNPVLEYLKKCEPERPFRRFTASRIMNERAHDLNMMANEFGFPAELFFNNDQAVIRNYLRKLDQEMDIVLVVEHLDESLVLMRRLLRWYLRHILYRRAHLNKRNYPHFKFGTAEENIHKVKAYLDYALYDFFLDKLLQIIKLQQSDFYEELAFFRKLLTKFETYCNKSINSKISKNYMQFDGSKWNKPFNATRPLCTDALRGGAGLFREYATELGLEEKQ